MDEKMAYPDTLVISDAEYRGRRNLKEGKVLIPYTSEPNVGIGDVIVQKSGDREILLKVIDISFQQGGSLKVGTKHPHMLTLLVENSTSQAHVSQIKSSTFNIGTVSGSNIQVGDSNILSVNITIHELVEKVAKSGDETAKSKLKEFLNNGTVASILGAGASALLAIL